MDLYLNFIRFFHTRTSGVNEIDGVRRLQYQHVILSITFLRMPRWRQDQGIHRNDIDQSLSEHIPTGRTGYALLQASIEVHFQACLYVHILKKDQLIKLVYCFQSARIMSYHIILWYSHSLKEWFDIIYTRNHTHQHILPFYSVVFWGIINYSSFAISSHCYTVVQKRLVFSKHGIIHIIFWDYFTV